MRKRNITRKGLKGALILILMAGLFLAFCGLNSAWARMHKAFLPATISIIQWEELPRSYDWEGEGEGEALYIDIDIGDSLLPELKLEVKVKPPSEWVESESEKHKDFEVRSKVITDKDDVFGRNERPLQAITRLQNESYEFYVPDPTPPNPNPPPGSSSPYSWFVPYEEPENTIFQMVPLKMQVNEEGTQANLDFVANGMAETVAINIPEGGENIINSPEQMYAGLISEGVDEDDAIGLVNILVDMKESIITKAVNDNISTADEAAVMASMIVAGFYFAQIDGNILTLDGETAVAFTNGEQSWLAPLTAGKIDNGDGTFTLDINAKLYQSGGDYSTMILTDTDGREYTLAEMKGHRTAALDDFTTGSPDLTNLGHFTDWMAEGKATGFSSIRTARYGNMLAVSEPGETAGSGNIAYTFTPRQVNKRKQVQEFAFGGGGGGIGYIPSGGDSYVYGASSAYNGVKRGYSSAGYTNPKTARASRSTFSSVKSSRSGGYSRGTRSGGATYTRSRYNW